MNRATPVDNEDWLRGACPDCEGWAWVPPYGKYRRRCSTCDGTGFRSDRTYTTGYGGRRWLFRPWHYVQHVRRGRVNSWRSLLFCTWCVDVRMAEFYAKPETPEETHTE